MRLFISKRTKPEVRYRLILQVGENDYLVAPGFKNLKTAIRAGEEFVIQAAPEISVEHDGLYSLKG
jgi:hypothetical protein